MKKEEKKYYFIIMEKECVGKMMSKYYIKNVKKDLFWMVFR